MASALLLQRGTENDLPANAYSRDLLLQIPSPVSWDIVGRSVFNSGYSFDDVKTFLASLPSDTSFDQSLRSSFFGLYSTYINRRNQTVDVTRTDALLPLIHQTILDTFDQSVLDTSDPRFQTKQTNQVSFGTQHLVLGTDLTLGDTLAITHGEGKRSICLGTSNDTLSIQGTLAHTQNDDLEIKDGLIGLQVNSNAGIAFNDVVTLSNFLFDTANQAYTFSTPSHTVVPRIQTNAVSTAMLASPNVDVVTAGASNGSNLAIAGCVSLDSAVSTGNVTTQGTLLVTDNGVVDGTFIVPGLRTNQTSALWSGTPYVESTSLTGNATVTITGMTTQSLALLVDDAKIASTVPQFDVNGPATLGSKTVGGGSYARYENLFTVNGSSSLHSLQVAGASALQGTLDVTGATSFTTLNNTLTVAGLTTLESDVTSGSTTVHGSASVSSALTAQAAAEFVSMSSGQLFVPMAGLNATASAIDTTRPVNVHLTLDSGSGSGSESTTFTGKLVVTPTSMQSLLPTSFLNSVVSTGAVEFKSTFTGVGTASIQSLQVNGATVFQDTLQVLGASTAQSSIQVAGSTHLQSSLVAHGSATLQSAVEIAAPTTLENKVNIPSSGLLLDPAEVQHPVPWYGATWNDFDTYTFYTNNTFQTQQSPGLTSAAVTVNVTDGPVALQGLYRAWANSTQGGEKRLFTNVFRNSWRWWTGNHSYYNPNLTLVTDDSTAEMPILRSDALTNFNRRGTTGGVRYVQLEYPAEFVLTRNYVHSSGVVAAFEVQITASKDGTFTDEVDIDTIVLHEMKYREANADDSIIAAFDADGIPSQLKDIADWPGANEHTGHPVTGSNPGNVSVAYLNAYFYNGVNNFSPVDQSVSNTEAYRYYRIYITRTPPTATGLAGSLDHWNPHVERPDARLVKLRTPLVSEFKDVLGDGETQDRLIIRGEIDAATRDLGNDMAALQSATQSNFAAASALLSNVRDSFNALVGFFDDELPVAEVLQTLQDSTVSMQNAASQAIVV
jgi:hypothetical protein